MDRLKVYLVVNGRGDCRLNKRRPVLAWDEVAFPITVQIPQGWGKVYEDVGAELTLPAPPEMSAPVVGAAETDDEDVEPVHV